MNRLFENTEELKEGVKNLLEKLFLVIPHLSDPKFDGNNWQEKAAHRLFSYSFGKEKRKLEESPEPISFTAGLLTGLPALHVPKSVREEFEKFESTPEEKANTGAFWEIAERFTELEEDDLNAEEFQKGHDSALNGFIDTKADPKRATSRTPIYFTLLMAPERFEQCNTVEDMYDLIFEGFPHHDLDAFKKLCADIGLRGKRYSKHKT